MKTILSKLLLVLLSLFAGFQVHAQIYNYTDSPDGIPALIATNATGTSLSRYKCDTTLGCGEGFLSDHFSKNDSFKVSRSSIDFSITPDAGYMVSASSISVELRRNLKGPDLLRIAYSTDGGLTWNTNGVNLTFENSNCDIMNAFSWDFDDFNTTSTVMFRFILFGSEGVHGVIQLKNAVLGGEVVAADVDGDGYGVDVDCNDENADINPGADEICNGIDDNCDGNIDEGLLITFYADADGDGYGDAESTTEACDMPEGYVSDDTDCNDGDAAVNPGATEVCNGMDDDCDGNVDEDIELAIAISPSGVIELCKPDYVTLSATAGFDSYQWYKNGEPLGGETDIDYETNKPAYYQVEGFMGACSSGLSEVQAVAVYESPNANIFYPDGLDLCLDSPVQLKASYDEGYTFQWYFNGNPMEGANTFTIFTDVLGDYYCEITLGMCVRYTATVTVFTSCKEGEVTAGSAFTISPNPVNTELSLYLSTPEVVNADASIFISEITGRKVYESSSSIANGILNETITLGNNLPDGIYFVTVVSGNYQWNEQIVVVR